MDGKFAYILINLMYLALSPLGYIYKKAFPFVLIGSSWAILYPLFTFIYKIDPVNSVILIFIFNIMLFGFAIYRNAIERLRAEWNSELRLKADNEKEHSDELEKLEAVEADIQSKELAVLKLYEITKRMSESLKFDNIFETFGTFLRENLKFRKCKLIIIKQDESGFKADRVFKVWGEGTKARHETDFDYVDLLNLLTEPKRELILTRKSNENLFEKLHLNEETDTFVAVPLLSEKKTVGILTIENLPHVDMERFTILAVQFALEIKKVLLYETVEALAITDGLTGLYVRRYFFERLNEEWQRSKRYKFKFSFLMIDIDNFKNCNDTYGHLVGDVVLKEAARVMKESVREIDLVARYGGEEFSIALPETGRDKAKIVGERIRKKIEEFVFKAYDEKLNITVSIGVAVYPDDSADIKELIEKADEALYAAKAAGKNLVRVYEK